MAQISKANKAELIAQDLCQKIRHRLYQPGEYLPSENQLTELYGTSRETIRNALAQLLELGLIQKIKGKGSIVLDYQKYSFPLSGITSFKELNHKLGMNAQTRVLTLEKNVTLPAKMLELGVDQQENTYVERLRLIDDVAVVLDRDYLLCPPITGITKQIAQNSLYEYIEESLHLEISYATKEFTIEPAQADVANKLGLTEDHLVVVVRSLSFLADTTLFQLTESYHRPDKFKFNDFARRQKFR